MTRSADLVVVGSGASGLAAALTAAVGHRRVLVLEKSDRFGGTSSLSGGSVWAPNNRYMAEAGADDSREGVLTYLHHMGLDRVDDKRLEAFVDTVNPMVEFLTKHTGLSWTPNFEHPDYQPDLPGAVHGGRTLQGGLFDTKRLGELRTRLRRPLTGAPITKLELDTWGENTPERWDWPTLEQRRRDELVGMGTALVGELLAGCMENGVELLADHRLVRFQRREDGRVTGVEVLGPSGLEVIDAHEGVVLASGGFEWDSELVSAFLGVPTVAAGSPPTNAGDGLRALMDVGASLANMPEAWWTPMMRAGEELYDGQQLNRTTKALRSLPGGIMVNRTGSRFVNEALNYTDLCKVMLHFDGQGYRYPNMPCWLVFDAQYQASYSVGPVAPGGDAEPWMHRSDTLEDLAWDLGIDPEGLTTQVASFNRAATLGTDPQFHRGVSVYDRYRGDASVSPNPNLRSLGGGPYFGVEVMLGCLCTKGGARTDVSGRVLDARGEPIPGLFACGDASANVFGPGYPGAGAPLASGMVGGYLIAQGVDARG